MTGALWVIRGCACLCLWFGGELVVIEQRILYLSWRSRGGGWGKGNKILDFSCSTFC